MQLQLLGLLHHPAHSECMERTCWPCTQAHRHRPKYSHETHKYRTTADKYVTAWLLQVAAVPEPQDNQEIVTLSLRFLDLATGSMKSETMTASISRPDEAPEGLQVEADTQEAIHRINTANAIRAAVRTADAHNLPE